jgi:hypothetical protein
VPWVSEGGTFVAALLVVFVPGALAAVILGFRGFGALALAAPLSLGAIAAASLVDAVIAFHWGVLAWIAVAVALQIVAVLARLLQQRISGRWREIAPVRRWSTWLPFVIVAVAALVLIPRLLFIFGAPDDISQTFDNIYHLNAVRFILDDGQIAPTRQLIPGFYPALWHAIVATVVDLSGASIPVAVNVVAAVVAGMVWPIACVAFTRQIVGSDAPALLAAGALSIGLGAFPILMLDFGVLYPNVLSISLLPSVLAALIAVTGQGSSHRPPPVTRWIVLLALIPTVALAHPSTLMAFLAIGIWPAGDAALRWFRGARARGVPRRRVRWAVAAWIAGIVVAAALLLVARPTPGEAFWGPSRTIWQAVVEVVTNGTVGRPWAWTASALMIIGIVAILVFRRRRWWLVAGWATLLFIYVVCAAFPRSIFRYGITGTWYSDLFRVTALLPAVVVPLAAIGFAFLVSALARAFPEKSRRLVLSTAGAAGAVVVLVLTQTGQPMWAATNYAHWIYETTPTSALLTTDERALIDRLPQDVPEDQVIAGSPWTGTSLSYALANRRVLIPHIYQVLDADMKTIMYHLDQAAVDPAVCTALERTGTRWVLDFGKAEIHGGHHVYPGLVDLADSGVVQLVDSEGSGARLYRITACS